MSETQDAPTRMSPAIVALSIGVVVVLLAGEPLVIDAPAFTAGYVLRMVALVALAGLAAVFTLIRKSRLPEPTGPMMVWLDLPLLIAIVALIAAPEGGGTGSAFVHHGVKWFVLAFLPFALAWSFERSDRLARLLGFLALVAAVLAMCGIIEVARGSKMAASFGRPAIAGAVFGSLLVPAILFGPGRGTPVRWVLPVFLAVTLITSGSRAATVAAVFGVIFAIIVGTPSQTLRRRASIAALVLMAIVVIGAGLASRGTVELPGGNRTLEVRLGLHRASFALIGERPLTGHGLGRYPVEALRRRDVAEARLEPGRRPEHAHLDALHVTVEGGILAGLALFLFLGGAFALATRRAVEADTSTRQAIAAAIAVLATLSIAGFGDGILIDPASILLASLAIATIVAATPLRANAGAVGLKGKISYGLALLLFLIATGLLGIDAVADTRLQSFVNARVDIERRANARTITRAEASAELEAAADDMLAGALDLDDANAEALYQRGFVDASFERFVKAKASYRASFASDPGKTEARLDLARVLEREGRLEDAKAVLEEATRHDPTRYDLWLRLGHIGLGPEPVPGDPTADRDWKAVLRPYNEARELSPDRFENDVALARVLRLRGELKQADLLLEKAAARFAPKGATGKERAGEMFLRAPAEISLEAFRIAETSGAGDLILNEFLQFALVKDPALGTALGQEVNRFLEIAEDREAEVKAEIADIGDPKLINPKAFDPVERVYDAVALRLAGLLETGFADGPEQLEKARAEKSEKRYRPSLARYRAILAWAQGPGAADLRRMNPEDALRWRADLLKETAVVASKVDAGRARTYWSRHFVLEGLRALGDRDNEAAIRLLRTALEYDEDFADTHFALARAYARQAEFNLAAKALIKSAELDPSAARKQAARAEPDFAAILSRPDVDKALR